MSADCSIEELPDGFTKIRYGFQKDLLLSILHYSFRSKNLDILFKRDFYEKKMNLDQSTFMEAKMDQCQDLDQKPVSLNESEFTAMEDYGCMSFKSQAQVSFQQLDIDEIPEFRPRQGTLDSINESGYSSSFQESFCYDQYPYQAPPCPSYPPPPPHHYLPPLPMTVPPPPQHHLSQFYLYSPVSNTLIPCEEVIVAQPFQSPEGPVYHNHTKAYVAYPVQGPDGRGYITQPFAPPPSYSSGSEKQGEDLNEVVTGQQTLDDNFNEVKKIGEDLDGNPRQNLAVIDDKLPFDCTSTTSVYIPGLYPTPEKKLKKRRKKKSKSKANTRQVAAKSSNSSSESETMESMVVAMMEYESNDFEKEYFDYVQEPVNEINLTDDLTNSLLNPPTEEDELETSAIAREIMNIVDTKEEKFEACDEICEHFPGNENVDQVRSSNQGIITEETDETLPTENGLTTKVQTKSKSKKKKRNHVKTKEVGCKINESTASNAEISNVLTEEVHSSMEVEEILEVPNEIEIVNEKKDLCQDDHPPPHKDVPGEEDPKEPIVVFDDKVEPSKEDFADGVNDKVRKRRRRGGKVSKEKKPPLQRVLVVDDQVRFSGAIAT